MISGSAEVCVLQGSSVFILLSFQCPLPVHSDLKMPSPTLPSAAVSAADDLDFHVSLPITLFFHSSLQTMDFLNCKSILPEPHPETDLHPSSNAELLNCQCGTERYMDVKKKHPPMSLEY